MKITRELLTSVAACLAFPAYSQTVVREYTLQIERQPVTAALTEFSRQTGLQVGYFPETLSENIFIGPLSGRYTAESAIAKLLGSSGLLFERLNERTIAVTGPGSARSKHRGFSTMERKVDDGATLSFVRLTNLSLADGPAAEEEEGQQTRTGANAWRSDGNKRRRDSLEEVIVTAQKREQRTFDVPISIVAIGADELQKRKITNIEDLQFAVPGLSMQTIGGYQRRIMLRGIGNFFGTGSLIGMYLDEAPVTAAPASQIDLRTYDLERVEVLRGPQGTLFGEGAAGGVIRFITKNPALDQFAMSADVAAMFTERGEPGQRVDAMFNVPLIENELGLRIAGTYDRQGGWIDQPAVGRNDYNDQELTNVRIKGLWQPAPQFTVSGMAVIHRNDTSMGNGEDADGNYTQVLGLTTTPSAQDDYDLYNLSLTYDFPAVQVLSATSYLKQEKDARNLGTKYQFEAPPAPRWEQSGDLRYSSSVFRSQELRLTSIGSGSWQWTVGGFYRDVVHRTAQARTTLGIPGYLFGLPDPFSISQSSSKQNDDRQSNESWAAFGDVSYELTDRVTFGTGLRYFENDTNFFTAFNPEGKGIPSTFLRASSHALSPRLYAQYKVAEHVNTYVSAAKGFRSGGVNGAPTFLPYDPEEVWTYELGTKMFLSGGRVTADVAVFHSDYTDYQITGLTRTPSGGVSFIASNGGGARIRGIEWGLTWRPTDQWNLSVNGDYLDTEFVEVNTLLNPATGGPTSNFAVGDEIDLIPKYQFTVSAQRDFTWNGRSGFTRLDYNQRDSVSYRQRTIGPWYFGESDVINMLNFNMSLQWNDRLSLGLFGQNLLNDRDLLDAGNIESFATRPRPRTYGIQFGVTF